MAPNTKALLRGVRVVAGRIALAVVALLLVMAVLLIAGLVLGLLVSLSDGWLA